MLRGVAVQAPYVIIDAVRVRQGVVAILLVASFVLQTRTIHVLHCSPLGPVTPSISTACDADAAVRPDGLLGAHARCCTAMVSSRGPRLQCCIPTLTLSQGGTARSMAAVARPVMTRCMIYEASCWRLAPWQAPSQPAPPRGSASRGVGCIAMSVRAVRPA